MRIATPVLVTIFAAASQALPPSYLEVPLPSGCDSMGIKSMNAAGNVAVGTARVPSTSSLVPAIGYNFGGASSQAYQLNPPAPYTQGTGEATNADGAVVLCTLWYSTQGTTNYAVGAYRGGTWTVIPMSASVSCSPAGISDDGSVAYGAIHDRSSGAFSPETPVIWSLQSGTQQTLPLPVSPEGQLTAGRVCRANITANGGILLGIGVGESRNYIIRWIITPFGVDTSIVPLPWDTLTPTTLIASRDCTRFAVTLYGRGTSFGGSNFARIAMRETFGTDWTTIMPTFEASEVTPFGLSGDGAVIAGSTTLVNARPFAWRGTTGTDLWTLAAQAGFSPFAPLGAEARVVSDDATTFAGNLYREGNSARGFFLIADVPQGLIPCDADFNRDGFVDGFDYDDFVQAFEMGCP